MDRDSNPDNITPKTHRERRRLGLLADAATRETLALMPWIVWALVFGALAVLAGVAGGCSSPEPTPALGRACECTAYPCSPDGCAGATCYGGTCSARCELDADCPAGAVCDVGAPGGCRWACEVDADCPDVDVAVCERGMCFAGPAVAR
jgi:hypothetical protein